MGVYQFMGLGRSIGAVTAPLSYIADRYERDEPVDQAFFAGSGEVGQSPDIKRGDVQALVFFTTQDVYDGQKLAYEYVKNQRGRTRGRSHQPESMRYLIQHLAKDDLNTLTDTARALGQSRKRFRVEVYWCLYEPERPTQTFERVTQCLIATKSVGSLGKEVWINLTGGTNVLNSALQLAISVSGKSARLYYTWTENPECVYHTVPDSQMGREGDAFWVDLPVIYFNFNEAHRKILGMLDTLKGDACSVEDIYELTVDGYVIAQPDGDDKHQRLITFRNQYLLPLEAQRLLVFDTDKEVGVTEKVINIGPNWSRLQRYYRSISVTPEEKEEQWTLPQLAETESWLIAEEWEV